MDENIDLVVSFDEDTGLKVNTHSKILDSLKKLTYYSFGSDFSLQEGNEWFSFIDLMAKSLAGVGGAIKNVYDSLGFINASGQTLDNAVSLAGITRNGLIKSYVDIKITRETADTSLIIGAPITLKDENNNLWICNEDIALEIGVTEIEKIFFASNTNTIPDYDLIIDANAKWICMTPYTSSETLNFNNAKSSTKGREKEEDSQLKYRYYSALYSQSTSTLDGLKSKLLNINDLDLAQIDATPISIPLNYVYIFNNVKDETDTTYNVAGHSIWVIVDGESIDIDDDTIAKVIYNYKSLGCGTSSGISTTGAIEKTFTVDGVEKTVNFSRAESKDCYISIELTGNNLVPEEKTIIAENIRNNLIDYVNNLGIHMDVLFSGVAKVIYDVQTTSGYEDYVFDITDIKVGDTENPTTTRLDVDIYQYATSKDIEIKFVGDDTNY